MFNIDETRDIRKLTWGGIRESLHTQRDFVYRRSMILEIRNPWQDQSRCSARRVRT